MVRRCIWIALGVLALLALTTTVAWARGEASPLEQEEDIMTNVLWVALTPLLAIATSVERILEMIWERWEKANVWPNPAGVLNTSSSEYILKKKMRSHWIGTVIAVIAIGLTNVRLFRLLGFDVLFSAPSLTLFDAGIGGIFDDFTIGTIIDWVLTAVIIGWGGTELTHSIIEGLVKGRGLWKEMREVEAGRKSILDAKFFNNYIAPELEKRGVSVISLRQAIETMKQFDIPVDELIGSMTIGKADEFLGQLEAQPETAAAGQALRTLLEGVPPEKQMEIPNVLALLTPELRERFLGA